MADCVIFAGVNGVGKTTLYNTLYLLRFRYKNKYLTEIVRENQKMEK